MIDSNIISKILKKNIIHDRNYLINKKYNVTLKTCMHKICGFKKKIVFILFMLKNLNNHLTNNFNIISGEKLTFINNKVARKFV